tara:strand:- start:27 stop:575 length:549 start_codon:yes stop_codon:yes gene_type:complete
MDFKRLDDYPRYRIYKNGDIYSEWSKTDKLMKLSLGNHGYYLVGLHNGSKPKNFLIHRLLAMLFIPNPYLKKEVDHINRIPTDNRLENLRWLDRSGQNLNKELKENNTGYPFITKQKSKSITSGFCFLCQIKRNRKWVLATQRANLEEAIEIVRTFLLENEYVFDGLPNETKQKIKEKYNII